MSQTREKILNSALKLFLKKGFAKTTIGEIERGAGLAPRAGSFYRHFKSKQELLIEIARTRISERPQEFDLAQFGSLDNTKAELLLFAQVYEQASERQKAYLPLIDEIRHTRVGKRLENKANNEMLKFLTDWISGKPAGKALNRKQAASLAIVVFGGWLFYLTKNQQGVAVEDVDRNQLIQDWADIWSSYLDTSGKSLPPATANKSKQSESRL